MLTPQQLLMEDANAYKETHLHDLSSSCLVHISAELTLKHYTSSRLYQTKIYPNVYKFWFSFQWKNKFLRRKFPWEKLI